MGRNDTVSEYFYLEESPYNPGYCIIRLDIDKLPFTYPFRGSYGLLPSRLLGINYADWLRLMRDEFDAQITGKNTKYPIAYFNYTEKICGLLSLLNKRVKYLLHEHNHPYNIIENSEGEKEKEYYEWYQEYQNSIFKKIIVNN